MNEFPQTYPIELGHNPSHLRVLAQVLDSLKNFTEEPGTDRGYSLFRVPGLNALKVFQRGF